MDRRTTIKWMFAAATTLPLGGLLSPFAAEAAGKARPYGSDPKLLDIFAASLRAAITEPAGVN